MFAKYKINYTKSCPKSIKILPKWRNFAKNGHTENKLKYYQLRTTITIARAKT